MVGNKLRYCVKSNYVRFCFKRGGGGGVNKIYFEIYVYVYLNVFVENEFKGFENSGRILNVYIYNFFCVFENVLCNLLLSESFF